jgi:3-methyladenine DNA glycosylase/8-oxoguanine DNA glycosylase
LYKEAHDTEFNAKPPFSFELTVHKPAGWWWSTPNEIYEKDTLWTAARFDQKLLGLKLCSKGTTQRPRVQCQFFAQENLTNEEKSTATNVVNKALNVKEDLSEFYSLAKKDKILRDVVEDLCGMRSMSWPDLLPALILAVTLQMAPMKRSNQMMDLIIQNFGDTIKFDGKTIRHWPSPEKLASTSVEDLKTKAKLGYRAANLQSIANSLENGFPTMQQLWEMPHDEAKKQLMLLRGIGDYSADIVVPGMGFPLDVWSAKIFHILLNGKETKSPREDIPKLKQTAEKRWGKWSGHVFTYVLNDLPQISKRIGIDLTQF